MTIPVGTQIELSEVRCGAKFHARYVKTHDRWWELKAWRLDLPNWFQAKRDGWSVGEWRRTRRERGLKPAYEKMGWPRVVTKWDDALWVKLGETQETKAK